MAIIRVEDSNGELIRIEESIAIPTRSDELNLELHALEQARNGHQQAAAEATQAAQGLQVRIDELLVKIAVIEAAETKADGDYTVVVSDVVADEEV